MENQNQQDLQLINISDGVYCRLKTVSVVCDIVDENGNLICVNGVTQSPDSVINLTGSDLAGMELPIQSIAENIFR